MNAIFVTGTDTDVGKTVVTGLLARFLGGRGYSVITQKWVQTGRKESFSDIIEHIKSINLEKNKITNLLRYMSPYNFKLPSSPHLAASRGKRRISKNKIKKSFKHLAKRFDFIIVEGAGGALVPFDNGNMLIDIARELKLPTLIVADNKLGAINHTVLTIEALKTRRIKLIGVIFNNKSRKVNKFVLRDNPRIVKKLTKEKILGVLPWRKDKRKLHKAFIPIGKRIIA